MSIETDSLIWLFPIMFMLHDFEELLLFEPWLKKNADEIRARIKDRFPAFLVKQIDAVLIKSTIELVLPISLIFGMTFVSSFLAVEYNAYGFFLLASGAFFLHGFMHVGQAIVLRRYIPAVFSSVLIVIPYGLVLYQRLTEEGIVDMQGLLIYFLCAVTLVIPFILIMHKAGDYLYRKTVRLLID